VSQNSALPSCNAAARSRTSVRSSASPGPGTGTDFSDTSAGGSSAACESTRGPNNIAETKTIAVAATLHGRDHSFASAPIAASFGRRDPLRQATAI
jgi:hypothetical protein